MKELLQGTNTLVFYSFFLIHSFLILCLTFNFFSSSPLSFSTACCLKDYDYLATLGISPPNLPHSPFPSPSYLSPLLSSPSSSSLSPSFSSSFPFTPPQKDMIMAEIRERHMKAVEKERRSWEGGRGGKENLRKSWEGGRGGIRRGRGRGERGKWPSANPLRKKNSLNSPSQPSPSSPHSPPQTFLLPPIPPPSPPPPPPPPPPPRRPPPQSSLSLLAPLKKIDFADNRRGLIQALLSAVSLSVRDGASSLYEVG